MLNRFKPFHYRVQWSLGILRVGVKWCFFGGVPVASVGSFCWSMGIRWERGCKMAAFCQVDVCGYLKHRASTVTPATTGVRILSQISWGKTTQVSIGRWQLPTGSPKEMIRKGATTVSKTRSFWAPGNSWTAVVQLVMGTRFQVDFNPYGKYCCSQIGSFPQVGIKKTNSWNLKPQPRKALFVSGEASRSGFSAPTIKSKEKEHHPTWKPTPREKKHTTGWWFQPLWKICSSNWIIFPGIGVKIPKIFELPPTRQPSLFQTLEPTLSNPPRFCDFFLPTTFFGQMFGPKKSASIAPVVAAGALWQSNVAQDVAWLLGIGDGRWVEEIPCLFKVLGIEILVGGFNNPSAKTWSQIGSWNPKWK